MSRFLRELWREISRDNIWNGAAALAYYLMLALFPAAIFLLSLLPFLPIPNLSSQIMGSLHNILPAQAADLLRSTVEEVTRHKSGGLLSFGLLFTLWSASSGIYAIMQQLNVTYDVVEGRPFWKVRAAAIGLLLLFMLLIIGSFALLVFDQTIQVFLAHALRLGGAGLAIAAVIRWVVVACAFLLGFALMYYYGPDVEQRFRFISPGSVTGVLCLVLASVGIKIYVSHFSNFAATYGGLGAAIILMLWLYVTGLVILFGSELNALLEHYHPAGKRKGEKREPMAA